MEFLINPSGLDYVVAPFQIFISNSRFQLNLRTKNRDANRGMRGKVLILFKYALTVPRMVAYVLNFGPIFGSFETELFIKMCMCLIFLFRTI